MASWDEYTQKATPEDADTLLIKDTAGAANKRTPFSGVWTWIVNKMTNAVIANLETTNKMIIPAINELNSKSYLLNGGTPIPENANLNDYNTPGNYYCNDNSQTSTFKNCPFINGFTLKVELSVGNSMPCQVFREFNTGKIAYRVNTSSGWSDYVYFSDDATVLSGKSGTWVPTLTAGVTVSGGYGQYYKIGKLVHCNVLIWIDTSQATDEELTISLPFTSDCARTYGTVGYAIPFNNNFPNLCVGIIGEGNKAQLFYGNTNGTTSAIKGNQISSAIQFTITYVTSE